MTMASLSLIIVATLLLGSVGAHDAIITKRAPSFPPSNSKRNPEPASASSIEYAKETAAPGTYFFTFGDSYSQTGFNITLDKPSVSDPLGNPPFPGWTTSGGANWIGFLTETYNESLVYSYNFAYGGATTDASLVAPFEPTVLSFIDQVTEFSNSVASKPSYAPWSSQNSLFAIWMGVNDVGNSWWLANETTLIDKIMDQYFNQTEILYQAGGRRFAFLTVPPIQRTPMVLESSDEASQEAEAAVIAQYNAALGQRAADFVNSKTDVRAFVVDTQQPFDVVLDNPEDFGTNATCYNSDGVTCAWWNNYHPGLAIHQCVALKFAAVVGAPFSAKAKVALNE